ncbi:MAG: protein phosphatase CheZ [Steroidobacteraceae bacterium]|jgi:chemotaxis protein CheZ
MSDFARRSASYGQLLSAMSEAIARGDEAAFDAAAWTLEVEHESPIRTGVRRVAGELQAALDQFGKSSRLVDLAERDVPDARQRLAHVLKLTDEAAHRTLDLVEQSQPLADGLARRSEELLSQAYRDCNPEVLVDFLKTTASTANDIRARLDEVLMTQGYQDISGQIIRGVMKLVDELEGALAELIQIGGLRPPAAAASVQDGSILQGPIVPGVRHIAPVAAQTDVDALLSGLGM